MDYVLFGMGYGATLMLLGWALRTFGPAFKYQEPDAADEAEFQVNRRFWIRFIQGLGGVLAIAGLALVFITFIVMLINPDDGIGSTMSLVIWGFIAVGLLVWSWLYFSRFGLTGIWSRKDGYGLRKSDPGSTPARRYSADRPFKATSVAPKSRVAGEESDDTAPALQENDNSEGADQYGPDQTVSAPDDAESEETEQPDTPAESAETDDDVEYDFGDSTDTTVPSEPVGRAEALRRLRERQKRETS